MKQYPEKKSANSSLSNKNDEYSLILYNDNFNKIDFIINSLIEICAHNQEQATQCAIIAHYKGKSLIKKGAYAELKTMKDAFTDRGINTGIE